MRAVDTNVLLRLLVRDDEKQVGAAEEFIGNGAWVSHLVLAETTWVLDALYERSTEQIAAALDMLLNHGRLSVQDADVVSAATENFRARPTLGFSDCLRLEIARKAGHLPFGTFDRNLAKLDGAVRLRQ
jgi:predicted nucleic-acid-binding protein